MASPDSRRLLRMVAAFIQIEALQDSRGYDKQISDLMESSGLISQPISVVFSLKSILNEYREYMRSKNGK